MAGPRKHNELRYYEMLGVPPTAGAEAIKRAYRKLAFRYHPDRNPSAQAEETFKQLTEAYEILTGLRKAPKNPEKQHAKPQPKSGTAAKPPPPKPPPPKPEATARKTTTKPPPQPVFAQCVITHKISAQPRYVEFEVVKGFLGRVEIRRVGGVMSPQGARKAALRASLTTWLLGFWGWKSWRRAFSAIIGNISGGTRPAANNARLLYAQARAFEIRGQKDTARAVALQAAAYAGTGPTGDGIRTMMRRLDNNRPVRKLKDEWRSGRGVSAFMQLSPAMVPIFALLWAVSPSEGTITEAVGKQAQSLYHAARARTETLLSGDDTQEPVPATVHYVDTDILNLRSGAGLNFNVVAYLDRFAEVQVMGPAEGLWVPVQSADGQIGYVSAQFLKAGSGAEAKRVWCDINPCDE